MTNRNKICLSIGCCLLLLSSIAISATLAEDDEIVEKKVEAKPDLTYDPPVILVDEKLADAVKPTSELLENADDEEENDTSVNEASAPSAPSAPAEPAEQASTVDENKPNDDDDVKNEQKAKAASEPTSPQQQEQATPVEERKSSAAKEEEKKANEISSASTQASPVIDEPGVGASHQEVKSATKLDDEEVHVVDASKEDAVKAKASVPVEPAASDESQKETTKPKNMDEDEVEEDDDDETEDDEEEAAGSHIGADDKNEDDEREDDRDDSSATDEKDASSDEADNDKSTSNDSNEQNTKHNIKGSQPIVERPPSAIKENLAVHNNYASGSSSEKFNSLYIILPTGGLALIVVIVALVLVVKKVSLLSRHREPVNSQQPRSTKPIYQPVTQQAVV